VSERLSGGATARKRSPPRDSTLNTENGGESGTGLGRAVFFGLVAEDVGGGVMAGS
jgi:hypothetical protein